ncbi:hypothetical protein KCP78_01530 [Salmonella enterica subsp. enterica]|nr:hypothetical protein KCP78_01530 [Salmonella enterica subsp. enterica]
MRWHSERLGNSRRVWILTTGDSEAPEEPLATVTRWTVNSGQKICPSGALASLTHQRLLPGAVYLLIDAIDTHHRQPRLLTAMPTSWLAVTRRTVAASPEP